MYFHLLMRRGVMVRGEGRGVYSPLCHLPMLQQVVWNWASERCVSQNVTLLIIPEHILNIRGVHRKRHSTVFSFHEWQCWMSFSGLQSNICKNVRYQNLMSEQILFHRRSILYWTIFWHEKDNCRCTEKGRNLSLLCFGFSLLSLSWNELIVGTKPTIVYFPF